jgi:hypothetical protein
VKCVHATRAASFRRDAAKAAAIGGDAGRDRRRECCHYRVMRYWSEAVGCRGKRDEASACWFQQDQAEHATRLRRSGMQTGFETALSGLGCSIGIELRRRVAWYALVFIDPPATVT